MIVCNQCKNNKPNTEFYMVDGKRQPKCILCNRMNARARYHERSKKKTCTSCGEKKPLKDFHKKREAKDGRQTNCKTCKSVGSNKRYLVMSAESKPDIKRKYKKPAVYSFEKFCIKCEKTKDKKDFCKNKSNKDGYQSYCKICQKADNKKYYQPKSRFKVNVRLVGDNPGRKDWAAYTVANSIAKYKEQQKNWRNKSLFARIFKI